MTNKHQCEGCGVYLQSDNPQELGYVPASALEREHILCQRCFKLRHYNKNVTVSLSSDDYLKMVSSIHDQEGIVVHIIDVFDVDGTLLKNLHRIVGRKKVFLVANKVDLLPKSTNMKKVHDWLRRILKEARINVEEVYLMSAKKGYQVDELAMALESAREQKDIYVVGVTNVGKSTFINALIKRSTRLQDAITTSYFPGTTLNFIKIPLDHQSAMIDTPGIVNEGQMTHYVAEEDLKFIVPREEVRPRNYQLQSGQTLFFGGLARLDFIKGDRQPFTCYFSNELPIHRTKLEKADSLYESQRGTLLRPPSEAHIERLPSLITQSYRISEPNTDIVFSGLGWVSVKEANITVELHYPKGVTVSLRESF